MKGRALGALAGLLLGSTAGAAEVVVLKSSDSAAARLAVEALRRVARGHTITEHDLRGDRGQGARVLAGLKDRGVVIVALGPLAAQLAREAQPEGPLVFAMVQDPARLGLTTGPAVTGVSFNIPVKNQLAAFRLVYPRGVRIGVLYTEENVGRQVQEAQKAAGLLRLLLVTRAVTSDREVPSALRALLSGDQAVDALWILPDPVLLGDETRRFILAETLKAGRPVFSFSSALVAEGALASNGPDFASVGEEAGDLVNRLAAGERRIDVQQPRAELIVNTKIAGKLKIAISPEALKIAKKF